MFKSRPQYCCCHNSFITSTIRINLLGITSCGCDVTLRVTRAFCHNPLSPFFGVDIIFLLKCLCKFILFFFLIISSFTFLTLSLIFYLILFLHNLSHLQFEGTHKHKSTPFACCKTFNTQRPTST